MASSHIIRKTLVMINRSYHGYYPTMRMRTDQFWNNRQKIFLHDNFQTHQVHLSAMRATLDPHQKERNSHRPDRLWTIPNVLCICRIGASPLLSYCILTSQYETAIGVLVAASITDFADGFIARKFSSQASRLGTFLDPLADKILIISLFSCLTYAELIPSILTSIIVLRDVALMTAGFYIRYKSLSSPKTLTKFFNASQSNAKLSPTYISKTNTVVQLSTAVLSLCAPIMPWLPESMLLYSWYSAGFTTLLSGLSYIFVKGTYEINEKSSHR